MSETTIATPNLTALEGILFDIGDTLLQISYDLEAGIRRLMELVDQTKTIGYPEARRIGDELGKSSEIVRLGANFEVSFEAFHRNIFDRFGWTSGLDWKKLDLEFFKASHSFKLEAGVIEALDLLRARGIRMGAVSNSANTGSTLEWQCRTSGIMHYFDFLISSADYGFRKPHPEIFETAIARLGLPRERVWFIGDRPHLDILGAKGVGLTAVWYNADGETECTPEPDLTITSWGEFAALMCSVG